MGQFMVLDVIQVQVSNPEDASSTLVTDDPDASIIASIPPDSSENSSSSSSDDDGASAGTIAGAVVGTLAGVALLLYAAYMLFWRPRQRQRVESGTTHMGPQDGGDSSTHFHSGQESRSPASTFVPSSNMVTTASGAPSSSGHHYHPQSSTLRPASTIDTQSNPSSLTYAQPVQPRDIGSSLVIQNNSEQEHVGGPAPLAPGEYPAPPPMHVQSCSIFSPKLTFEHHRYSRASSSDPKGHFDSQYRPSQSVQ